MNSQEVIDRVNKGLTALNLQIGEVREVERGGVKMIQIGDTVYDLILAPISRRKLTPDGLRTVEIPGIYLYQRHCDFQPGSRYFNETSEELEGKPIEQATDVLRTLFGRLVDAMLTDLLKE